MTHEDLGLLVKKWINIHYILPDEVVTFLLEVVIDHCVISKAAPPLEGQKTKGPIDCSAVFHLLYAVCSLYAFLSC